MATGMIIALVLAAAAVTQTPPHDTSASPPAPSKGECELHVWPAESNQAISFFVSPLIRGRSTDQKIEGAMDDLLSPAAQLVYLREANVLEELKLSDATRIVEHSEPADPKSMKGKGRMSTSASPCYAELVVAGNILIEDIVWGDRFMTFFQFRHFADQPSYLRRVSGEGTNKLKILTLPEGSRPSDASEIAAKAFRANFFEWTKKARVKMTAMRARAR